MPRAKTAIKIQAVLVLPRSLDALIIARAFPPRPFLAVWPAAPFLSLSCF